MNLFKSTSTLGFFLNVFTEFAESSDKNICHYSKRAQTCYILCTRPGCYHSTSMTLVRNRIFKLSPVCASVIYQILWIWWSHWSSAPFRKKSIVDFLLFSNKPLCNVTFGKRQCANTNSPVQYFPTFFFTGLWILFHYYVHIIFPLFAKKMWT